MLNRDLNVEWLGVGPYRFYNYAMLHSGGVDHVIDTMRYDNAFFAREQDMLDVLATANDQLDFVTKRLSILLCRPDHKGIKKPGWTPARLLSDQEFEYIEDPVKLMDLGPNLITTIGFQASPPLKLKGDFRIEGDLAYILRVMYDNRAVPDDESSAHAIESAFHHPTKTFPVRLTRMASREVEIKLPVKV